MGWEIYPDGLRDFLIRTHQEYTEGLPILVTENGMANPDVTTKSTVPDPERIQYIDQHLQAVNEALDHGVPVAGYYAWSLLDNYEWALGYEKRFGLVHVDFETLKRRPKDSYFHLKKLLSG